MDNDTTKVEQYVREAMDLIDSWEKDGAEINRVGTSLVLAQIAWLGWKGRNKEEIITALRRAISTFEDSGATVVDVIATVGTKRK